jgi:uncharacterized membrane protein YoaT (DUF817 family)
MAWDVRGTIAASTARAWHSQVWLPARLRLWIERLAFFTVQEALSCIFPVLIFTTLAVTSAVSVPGLHRYDLILLVCLAIQAAMLVSGLETRDELKVICVFHVLGLTLELFKVAQGSWSYPDAAWSKVGGVPLYSGFMYASVASYLCQAWRRLDVRLDRWPRDRVVVPLAIAVYGNFFTHHWLPDIRWWLTAAIFVVFFRARATFAVPGTRLWIPLPLAFVLIGFFIWIAENIATFFNAWQYPSQSDGWEMVHLQKISSWFLLVIISFIAVAALKHVKEAQTHLRRHDDPAIRPD